MAKKIGRPPFKSNMMTSTVTAPDIPFPLKLNGGDWKRLHGLLSKGIRAGARHCGSPEPFDALQQMTSLLILFLRQEEVRDQRIIDISQPSVKGNKISFAAFQEILLRTGANNAAYFLKNRRRRDLEILNQLRSYANELVVENNVVPDPDKGRWYRIYHGDYRAPNAVVAFKALAEIEAFIKKIQLEHERNPDAEEMYCRAGCGTLLAPGQEFCPDSTPAHIAGKKDADARTRSCYFAFHKQLKRWRAVADRQLRNQDH